MSKFASLPPLVSDASRVTCDGNGLKRGYRNKQCTFNVDTSHAGEGEIFCFKKKIKGNTVAQFILVG